MSSHPADIKEVTEFAAMTIRDRLKIEIFGFHDSEEVDALVATPLSFRSLSSSFSDRYLEGERLYVPNATEARKVLFPFSVPMDPETLETWTLQIGEDENSVEVPVPAPGTVILNYLTRSISGLRTKDAEKIDKVATAVLAKCPETLDWIIDGPGSSQFELARILHTLREPKYAPRPLKLASDKLVVRALRYGSIPEHEAFLLRDNDNTTQGLSIRLSSLKARGLHLSESNPRIVSLWQRYGEDHVKSILHNGQT
jgi:hypothetical protein